MPLRPDEIENREFASSLRGFDKHEVRAFLRRIASDVDELETQQAGREPSRGDAEHDIASSEALARFDEDRFAALGDRIAGLLRQAHDAATETRQEAEQRALQLRSAAEDELEQARVEASRFREEAEAVALALRTSAEDESARLRAEAEDLRAEAVTVRNDAEDYANHLRGEADSVRAEAEEFASRLRGEAEGLRAEAERAQDEAQRLRGEAQEMRNEADEYAGRIRGEAESDAAAIRDRAELEGAARLDERRMALEQAQAEVEAERLTAFAEVAEARGQVSTLLEEARAQSEFIKREAEEIVRAKVRTNVDQAQRRIDLLRNTETSSRNRILTAQRELEAALGRLDAAAAPELGIQTEEDVLAEAERRSLAADYPPFRSVDRAGSFVVDEGGESDEVIEAHVIEGQVIEGQVIDVGFDVIEGEVLEDEFLEDDVIEDEFLDETGHEGDVEVTVDVASEGPETSYRPSTGTHGQSDVPDDSVIDGGDPEAEGAVAPQNEDALARLVREAMQRAVEGARNENR